MGHLPELEEPVPDGVVSSSRPEAEAPVAVPVGRGAPRPANVAWSQASCSGENGAGASVPGEAVVSSIALAEARRDNRQIDAAIALGS